MLEPGRNLETRGRHWRQVVEMSGPRMGVVMGMRVPRGTDWAQVLVCDSVSRTPARLPGPVPQPESHPSLSSVRGDEGTFSGDARAMRVSGGRDSSHRCWSGRWLW